MDDHIHIKNLLVRGILGVNEWERRKRQDIVISVTITCDLRPAGESDDLEDTVNYRTVCKKIVSHVESSHRFTAEALAADVARLCLEMSGISSVRVRIEKPGALRFAESVGVEIERHRGDGF